MGILKFTKPVRLDKGPTDSFWYNGRGGTHKGIDYPSKNPKKGEEGGGGEKVVASERGVVVRAAMNPKTETRKRAYGMTVVIDHTPYAEDRHSSVQCLNPEHIDKEREGYTSKLRFIYTLYAHLKEKNVWPGKIVNKGDVIGVVGNTGMSTGPHLHFEVIDTYIKMPWANGTDFSGAMGVRSGVGRKHPMFYYGVEHRVDGTVEPDLERCDIASAPRPRDWSATEGIIPVEKKVIEPFVRKPSFPLIIRGGRGNSGSGQRSGRR